jgi:hypothetical protein
MPIPFSNILRHYSRAARFEIVRWREVEGLATEDAIARAGERWPELPAVEPEGWRAWQASSEYLSFADQVRREQAERERLSDTYCAAGGLEALAEITDSAAYVLAAKAIRLAEETDDPRQLGPLMRTIREAKGVVDENLRERHERQLRDQAAEYHAAIADLQEQIAERDAEIARLSGKRNDSPGLRPETIAEMERRLRLL